MTDKPIFELASDKGIPTISKGSPLLGLALLVAPGSPTEPDKGDNQFIKLNYTGAPGSCTNIYLSLVYFLLGQGFHVAKVDEWIDVSPEHAQYYQMTMAQRQQLEATIKTGLASAAQAVADYELIKHDLRKYEEVLKYFKERDEHSLKAMFIDQVDIHTDLPNTPIAMRSIVSRWPTIINDFMKIRGESDIEPKKLGVSQAECVILRTKFKLYENWKVTFLNTAKERYSQLHSLVTSRKKSIEEYRTWLKPYLSRFKMMHVGLERPSVIKQTYKSFSDLTGQATFGNHIRIWAWRAHSPPEVRKAPIERLGKFLVRPDDDFVKEMFIFNKERGLANIYPWLLNEKDGKRFGSTMIEEIVDKEWNPSNGLDPEKMYYFFFDITAFRTGSKTPTSETESISFDVKTYVISQNIMLVKYIELKCREHEMERYIDEILGVSEDIVKKEFPELFEEKKPEQKIKINLNFLAGFEKAAGGISKIRVPSLVKSGPYERDFTDRIPIYYISPAGGSFSDVKNFLKSRMGIE